MSKSTQKIRYVAFEYWPEEPIPAILLCELRRDNISSTFPHGDYNIEGGRVVYDLKADAEFNRAAGCTVKWGAEIKGNNDASIDTEFAVDLTSNLGVNVKLVAGTPPFITIIMFNKDESELSPALVSQLSSVGPISTSGGVTVKTASNEDEEIIPPRGPLYIINSQQQYLSRWGDDGLKFKKTTPDQYCLFEATYSGRFQHYLLSTTSLTPNVRIKIDRGQDPPALWLTRTIREAAVFKIQSPDRSLGTFYLVANKYITGSTESGPEDSLAMFIGDVDNASPTATAVETLAYEYTKSTVGTWNHTLGWEIGGRVTFKAGTPVLGVDKEISISASGAHEWGQQNGETHKFTASVAVTVPPSSKVNVTLIVKRRTIDVPFTYTETRTYPDQRVITTRDKSGVYKNLETYRVSTQLSEPTAR
ncbi:hypothetical protein B0H17DRAFT_1142301 [Mycena rosella]|uniref:Aerolysin-like C-terminal domain-containing protein n=1 Tax=Mycena rosella TaxID=1033263 RepID=A0AAD7G590_MYCRO|nr:hypothetical protein B0H17DRAFT_1142301 [Mycena rosella]